MASEQSVVPARLVGGPFDGDEGNVDGPPPNIYCVSCPGGSKCPMKGIHWFLKKEDAEEAAVEVKRKVERYAYARKRKGVHLFTYGDMDDDPTKGPSASEKPPSEYRHEVRAPGQRELVKA